MKKSPFATIVSMIAKGDGPSGETRTRGILVPNQAPYQLGHTRIIVTCDIIHTFLRKCNQKFFREEEKSVLKCGGWLCMIEIRGDSGWKREGYPKRP